MLDSSTDMVRDELRQILKRDEGTGPVVMGRLMPYRDCCGRQVPLCTCEKKGAITAGWGHNLEAKGLTYKMAEALLEEDIDDAIKDCVIRYPWFELLSPQRQAMLAMLMFNLGPHRLNGFRRFLASAKAGDHETAAAELLDSKWADQVGARARRIAEAWRRDILL